jgi:hypothetical protein
VSKHSGNFRAKYRGNNRLDREQKFYNFIIDERLAESLQALFRRKMLVTRF